MDLPYRLKNPMTVTEWDPTQFFREGYPSSPYALLILNHPINEKAYDVLQRHGEYFATVCSLKPPTLPLQHKHSSYNTYPWLINRSMYHGLRRRRRKPILRDDEGAREGVYRCEYRTSTSTSIPNAP